jgi:prepilin peptidase CpaA
MQGGFLTYALLMGLATALLVAAFTDLRRRQIDNWLNAAIALGAPVFWLVTGLDLIGIGYQFAIAAGTFTILAAMFALGAMGGGDVKLLTALALWIKPLWFLKLVIVMALVGGVLTLIFGGLHLMRRKRDKVAIPYGIAISFAGLWVLANQYLPVFQTGGHLG